MVWSLQKGWIHFVEMTEDVHVDGGPCKNFEVSEDSGSHYNINHTIHHIISLYLTFHKQNR